MHLPHATLAPRGMHLPSKWRHLSDLAHAADAVAAARLPEYVLQAPQVLAPQRHAEPVHLQGVPYSDRSPKNRRLCLGSSRPCRP